MKDKQIVEKILKYTSKVLDYTWVQSKVHLEWSRRDWNEKNV